jgi:A/G-specific adenine glycosylase
VNRRLWSLASELIPSENPGDFNQALMELGALVCTPKAPSCPKCPISRHCGALRAGTVERHPETGPAEKTERIEVASAVIRRDGNVLVAQRPKDGVLGGLWEFPGVEGTGRLPAKRLLRRAVKSAVGLEIEIGEHLVTVSHAIMNRRITLEVYLCEARQGEARALKYDEVRWVSPERLSDMGLSSAPRRIAKALLAWATLIRR